MGKTFLVLGVLTASVFAAGCNLLTGSDELALAEGDGGEAGSSGAGEAAGGLGGAGGGGAGTGGTPAGPTSVGPGVGGGASGPTTSTTTNVTTGPTACEYPAGPYGLQAGQRLDPSLTWQGYRANGSTVESISILDLFDCDGSKNIDAVLIIGAQTTCGPCQAEAQDISPQIAGWTADGIHVLTLMVPGGAAPWRNAFSLQGSNVADDPTGSILLPGSNGTPINILWDPRTGLIVDRWNGYGLGYQMLESLAAENDGGA